jgi:hypothetical protein
MNNFNLKKLIEPLASINLSEQEKGSLRLRIIDYVKNNPAPVATKLSFVKYLSTATLSLVVIFGSGSLITFASQHSLPGQFLYPVKRASEQVAARTITATDKKINYSLSLIEKRYVETNQLLIQQSLDGNTESAITADIENHIADIQKQTELIAKTNPAEALSYNTKLAQTLKTNTQVFLAVSDKNKSINDANTVSQDKHTKIVLSAYKNAAKLALKTEQLQQVVLSDIDLITIKTAEKKYNDIRPKIDAVLPPLDPTPLTIPLVSMEPVNEPVIEPDTVKKLITEESENSKPIPKESEAGKVPKNESEETDALELPINESSNEAELESIASLVKKLDNAYVTKRFNDVIVLADKIDQIISNNEKIKAVEEKYNVIIPTVLESDTKLKMESVEKTIIDKK